MTTSTSYAVPGASPDLYDAIRARVDDLRRMQEAGLVCRSGAFYPSITYPPITRYAPISDDEMFRGYAPPADGLFAVYAHVPFCVQRCLFCHYPALYGERAEEKDRYLAALEREIDLFLERFAQPRLRAHSILVGGGTPTYLAPAQLERLLRSLDARLDRSAGAQYSFDVDPVTLLGPDGAERLRLMRSYGVSRLTIGVQSFDDGTLQVMNRHHGAREALDSVEAARNAGFQVNLDFIFGHPGQTLESWLSDVERAIALGVEEIQLYRLKVEAYGDLQGTIKRFLSARPGAAPGPEDAIAMKAAAIALLERGGYRENLRRVFTRERAHYSRYAHDMCCALRDQIGFGLTGFSNLRDRFALNTQRFDDYYRRIDEGRLPVNRGLVRSREDQIRWAIALPLKNRSVRRERFEEQTGVPLERVFRHKVEALRRHGLVSEDRRGLELTRLGAFFADEIAHAFYGPEHIPFPADAYAPGALHPYADQDPFA